MILLACAVEAELAFWQPRAGRRDAGDRRRPRRGVVRARRSARAARATGSSSTPGSPARLTALRASATASSLPTSRSSSRSRDGAPLRLPRGESSRRSGALRRRTRRAASRPRAFRRFAASPSRASPSTEETARRLARELGAQVESMEGFAALRAARARRRSRRSRCAASQIAAGTRESKRLGLRRGNRRPARASLDALFELCGLATKRAMTLYARVLAMPERHVHLRRADERPARRRARGARAPRRHRGAQQRRGTLASSS